LLVTGESRLKITFNPHIVGYGHRVRCNLIGKEIQRLKPKAKIVFLDRKDDSLYNEDWTPFKRVHGGFRRTLSLFTSSCLVEDCTMIEDWRRKWFSRMGKIVTILNPTLDSDFPNHKHNLEHNELIILCYPEDFFPFPDVLEDFREKVAWFGPVLNLPSQDFKRRIGGGIRVNILLSRGREQVVPLVQKLSKDLGFQIMQTKFKSDREHFSALSETTIAITQGTTAVFECSQLGIPQLCLPLNEEQLVVARRFEEVGALALLPMVDVTEGSLRQALGNLVSDEGLRGEMVRKGKEFSSPPGTKDIARAIVEIITRK